MSSKRRVLAVVVVLALLCTVAAFITEGWNLLPEGYVRSFLQAMFSH